MAKILVVDDNDLNRDLLEQLLQMKGHEVVTAANGAQAVGIATAYPPDLVLLDIDMPVMDGLEAVRHIKASATSAKLPVIAVSAHALPADRQRALEAGCDDYLTKPIDVQLLLSKLETFLRRP